MGAGRQNCGADCCSGTGKRRVRDVIRGLRKTTRRNEDKRVRDSPVDLHGDVVARLAQLQVKAADLWGVRVTQRMLVAATGISLKMIQALSRPLRRQTNVRYDLVALGKLCWYFGCEIDDLLAYLLPGGVAASLPDIRVGRIAPPSPGETPPQTQTVHTRLPDALRGERVVDIMRATRRQRDTIAAIRDGKPKQVKRVTLAALCDAGSQKGSRPVRMGEVLVYTGLKPWETTRAS